MARSPRTVSYSTDSGQYKQPIASPASLSQVPPIGGFRAIQEMFAAVSRSGGLPADKWFFDVLSGDE